MIKIGKNTAKSKKDRFRRKKRIRSNLSGDVSRPRLSVFRSNAHIYVQLIDDIKGATLASASTLEEELKGKATRNVEGARLVGSLIAKRALAKNINTIVFDRSGYLYHGRIKALADAARESGLQF